MTTVDRFLGACPGCDSLLAPDRLLLTYQTAERSVVFAECPVCREIVFPE